MLRIPIQRMLTIGRLSLAMVLCVAASSAGAASLTGQVTADGGAGLQDMVVTLWAEDATTKSFAIVRSETTDASGNFSMTSVVAGEYLLHARMGPGLEGNYADQWYDVEEPSSSGYVGADADRLLLSEATDLTGLTFALPVVGGMDGRIIDSGGGPIQGIQVRVEQASDPRIHHNDITDGNCCDGAHYGRYYMRGLVPSDDYRVLAHDPLGSLQTGVRPGPHDVVSGSNLSVSDLTLTDYPASPYEPNDAFDAVGSDSVDSVGLHAVPPVAWRSAGAFIGPRGSDVDWHCFDGQVGDRLLLSVSSVLDISGEQRESPFVDPILSLQTGDGTEVLIVDDDSGPGRRDAFIDTGEILGAGRLCAVVSTFGDTTWSGASQQSAGSYELSIEMGNRRPTLEVLRDDVPIPESPELIVLSEGDDLDLALLYEDPEDDVLVVTVAQYDSGGTPVTEFDLLTGANSGSYFWSADETAAVGSPYTLVVGTSDGEFATVITAVVQVTGVNQPPSTPVQLQPTNAANVRASEVTLVVENSMDADADPLLYEYEVYYDENQGVPAQVQLVTEAVGGETSWTTDAIADDTFVFWRVRAYDGGVDNAYSPWSETWSFLVNASNAAPSAPALLKPENGEEVMVRWPTMSVNHSQDPEGDAIAITFEVATDPEFSDRVTDSGPVPQSVLGSTTAWTIDVPLDWGAQYYGRARAADDLGSMSPYSNVNVFRIKPNGVSGAPGLGPPFAETCSGQLFPETPPEEIRVANIDEPDGEEVTLELEIHPFDVDPDANEPLISESVPQDTDSESTVIAFDNAPISSPGHYRIRVRGYDGSSHTEWGECDFFVAEPPGPATDLEILSPEDGTVFPRETTEIDVVVQNAADPSVATHEGLALAYCASPDPNYSRCEPDAAAWDSVPQSSMDSADTTSFSLSGFESGQNWWVRVCSLRVDGSCPGMAEVTFSIQPPKTTLTPGCNCGTTLSSANIADVALWLLLLGFLTGPRRKRSRA